MEYNILLLPGDGIGPEITAEAVKVLKTIGQEFGHSFNFKEGLIGGVAIDKKADPLPASTIEHAKQCDAVLLGAVGGPKWDSTDPNRHRPEQGLLGLRKVMGVFANVRPVKAYKQLLGASTLKSEVIKEVDLVIVRELTSGIYFGKQNRKDDSAYDTCEYDFEEIDRVIKFAANMAKKRDMKITSVDKANVLETSRLWRERVEIILDESDIKYQHMLVDNCAMQLIKNPAQFDVIVTENMFGDILSDEAAMLTGSIGMLSSGSFGGKGPSLFEPIHGSAPDIAGKNLANPIATITSCAMMLRHSFDLPYEADAIESAIHQVLEKGYRTLDIMENVRKLKKIGTDEMGTLIADLITS